MTASITLTDTQAATLTYMLGNNGFSTRSTDRRACSSLQARGLVRETAATPAGDPYRFDITALGEAALAIHNDPLV